MTANDPRLPRCALWLLERCVADGAPLAGDLAEEFARGRSRGWIWRQVVAAIASAWLSGPDEIRPLRLVELQPVDAQIRSRGVLFRFDPVNLTASPLHGIGGLGLLIFGLLISVVAPLLWVLLLGSVLLGIAFGGVLIGLRRAAPFRH